MWRNIAALVLLGVGLVIAGCGADERPEHSKRQEPSESTQTFRVSTGAAVGPNVRLLSITSEEHHPADQEKEIRARLEEEINGGKLNIVAVKTSYSSGHLTSGEISYDVSGTGRGNDLRVLFVYSDQQDLDDKTKEVQPRMDKIVNSGQYNLVNIQTVYMGGRLLAGEVYYRSK